MRSQVEPRFALNTICPYYTMFPIEFPLRQLERAREGQLVLDPFCGRGTTLYAARLRGLRAVGVDSNPVAAAIAAAKLVTVSARRVIQVAREILRETKPTQIPTGRFWSLCYHEKTLADICKLREALLRASDSPAIAALRAVMLGALHGQVNKGEPTYLSNQMPRTYAAKPDYAVRYWRRKRKAPPNVNVLDVIRRRATHYFDNPIPRGAGMVQCADSRVFCWKQHGKARWIVTSPPYYGMRTYVPDQWLRYWFLGGPRDVEYQFDSQLSHESPERFSEQLAEVWSNVSKGCANGARMIVRFGAIRDRDKDPRELLLRSFNLSDSGWRVLTSRSAGKATQGKRQADQFKRVLKKPIEEYDFHLRLNG